MFWIFLEMKKIHRKLRQIILGIKRESNSLGEKESNFGNVMKQSHQNKFDF